MASAVAILRVCTSPLGSERSTETSETVGHLWIASKRSSMVYTFPCPPSPIRAPPEDTDTDAARLIVGCWLRMLKGWNKKSEEALLGSGPHGVPDRDLLHLSGTRALSHLLDLPVDPRTGRRRVVSGSSSSRSIRSSARLPRAAGGPRCRCRCRYRYRSGRSPRDHRGDVRGRRGTALDLDDLEGARERSASLGRPPEGNIDETDLVVPGSPLLYWNIGLGQLFGPRHDLCVRRRCQMCERCHRCQRWVLGPCGTHGFFF